MYWYKMFFQKAEVEKQLKVSEAKVEQFETEKKAFIVKIHELSEQANNANEQMQKTSFSQIEELEELRKDKELFNMETEVKSCVLYKIIQLTIPFADTEKKYK